MVDPPSLSEAFGDFRIEIKLRSKSKAARNDPELTLSERELYRKALSEQSNGGPPTAAHYFAAHRAVRGTRPPFDGHNPNNDVGTTLDDDDVGKGQMNDSLENGGLGMQGAGKSMEAQKSRTSGLLTDEHSEQSEVDKGESGDDDESEQDAEDDGDEYAEEDEECSEDDSNFEFK